MKIVFSTIAKSLMALGLFKSTLVNPSTEDLSEINRPKDEFVVNDDKGKCPAKEGLDGIPIMPIYTDERNKIVRSSEETIDGKVALKEEYNSNDEAIHKTEISTENGKETKKETKVFYQHGRKTIDTYINDKQVKKETYGPDDKLTQTEEYSYTKEDGNEITIVTLKDFNYSGKPESTTVHKITNGIFSQVYYENYYYDKEGKLLSGAKWLPGEAGPQESWMYSKDGKTKLEMGSFSGNLDALKAELNTEERYLEFEKLVSEGQISLSPKAEEKLRKHGETVCKDLSTKTNETRQKLEEKWGVKINVSPLAPSGYTGKRLPLKDVDQKLKELDNEMKKYPPDFFKKRGLEIQFFSKLKSIKRDKEVGGTQYDKTIRLVDIAWGFDHEVYHFFDRNFNGKRGLSANDSRWEKDADGKYAGNKGFDWFDKLKGNPTWQPGLDEAYQFVDTDEDQADFAQRIFKPGVDNYMLKLKTYAAHREVMAKHRKQVIEEYKKWSGGLMDEKFFDDIMNGNITNFAVYWQNRTSTPLVAR